MIENNKNRVPIVVTEIIEAEMRRAKRVMADPVLGNRVGAIRQKYIVDGFLMPVYGRDGRYTRSKIRVSQFGNFILPEKTQGTVFFAGKQGWIRNEPIWFWEYLKEGQEVVSSDIELGDKYGINGIPANLIWPEIVDLVKVLHLDREAGGGILFPTNDIDIEKLSSLAKLADNQECKDSYQETYQSISIPNTPRWMELFDAYDSYKRSRKNFDIGPAWFHLVKYIFFNTPMRLPVFTALFTTEWKLKELKYLDDDLSDQARSFLGKELLKIPLRLRKLIERALKHERNEITWWLWHSVGYPEKGITLSLGAIARMAGAPKSSIQRAVEGFDKKVRAGLTGKLLGELLQTGLKLGIDPNILYHDLEQKGLVPKREREIDGFDDLEKLI
jgi:hypothetical protein